MGIFSNVVAGFLAGFSVGIYCLGLCLPIFLPLLLSQKRPGKSIMFLVLEFSLGRLLGYLFFGLLFGWFGQIIKNSFIHYVAGLANMWIGFLMVIYSLGIFDQKICATKIFRKIKWPLVLGFLTGVNICPPFLGSLTYIFNLRSVVSSLIYFLTFFLGTSVYIIPFSLFGFFLKSLWMQKIARFCGVVVGMYFIITNLIRIW